MGYKHTSTLVMPAKPPSEERVGDTSFADDGLACPGTKKNVSRLKTREKKKPLVKHREPIALGPNGGLLGAHGHGSNK